MDNKVFIKKSDVVTRNVAGESILVPISGDVANMQHIFALSPVAEFIWSKLDGKLDVAQIIQMISEEFEVDSATAATDCKEFVQSLIDNKLVSESV